jgi:hypothetical protein
MQIDSANDSADSETTGFPGLKSWRAVYLLVVGSFLLWVGLLIWLSRAYQ